MILNILSTLVALVSISGTIVNMFKKRQCYILWGISNFSWLTVGIVIRNPGLILQNAVYCCISVTGYIKWRRDDEKASS